MAESRHLLDDLQASTPEVQLGLSRAGVRGVEKAIRLRWGGAEKMISLIGIAAASKSGVRRIVGVEATGINACPCAQGLVRGQASERLLEAGFDGADVERILELVPLATHNQRGRGTLYVGTELRLDATELVGLVERSM